MIAYNSQSPPVSPQQRLHSVSMILTSPSVTDYMVHAVLSNNPITFLNEPLSHFNNSTWPHEQNMNNLSLETLEVWTKRFIFQVLYQTSTEQRNGNKRLNNMHSANYWQNITLHEQKRPVWEKPTQILRPIIQSKSSAALLLLTQLHFNLEDSSDMQISQVTYTNHKANTNNALFTGNPRQMPQDHNDYKHAPCWKMLNFTVRQHGTNKRYVIYTHLDRTWLTTIFLLKALKAK